MNNENCEQCGNLMKLVPAGTSKTKIDKFGNPKKYDAFYTCESCKPYKGKKPTEGQPDASHTEIMSALRNIYKVVDDLAESFRLFTKAFTKKDED